MKTPNWIVLLCGVAGSTATCGVVGSTAAEEAKQPFHLSQPERLPFLPEIVEDHAPEVCAYAERAIRRGFTKVGRAVFDDEQAVVPFHSYSFEIPGLGGSWEIRRAEVDIDNDGTGDLLVRYDTSQGGTLQPAHYLTRFRDERHLLDRIESSKILNDQTGSRIPDDTEPPRSIRPHFDTFGRHDTGEFRISDRADFTIFSHGNRQYLYLGPGQGAELTESIYAPDIYAAVVEYGAQDKPVAICRFRTALEPKRLWSEPSLTDFKAYDDLLSLVRGRGSRCGGGSSHPEFYLRNSRLWTLHAAVLAPWRFVQYPYGFESRGPREETPDPDRERWVMLRALGSWAEQRIWNFKTFDKLEDEERSAISALAQYYVDTFGYDQKNATELANLATTALLSQTFTIGTKSLFEFAYDGGRDHSHQRDLSDQLNLEIRHALVDQHALTRLLERALLYGKTNRKQLEALIAQGASIDGIDEPALFFALGSTARMSLIMEHGADINATSAFGKTALMYAAQFGDKRVAAFLIERGADLNLATHAYLACGHHVRIGGRTALMYAAENSLLGMVETLLSAGANPRAEDSRGWRAKDYLSLNTIIRSPGERLRALELLGP